MKGLKYIGVILIILLLVTACSPEIDIEDEEEEVSGNYIPTDGGTMTISTTRFQTFNPLFNRNKDLFQIHHLLYEGLVTFKEDMSIEPLLAKSWKFNGGESVDFTLRTGVKWHDGEPLTVDDVIFTFDAIKGNIRGLNKISVYRQSLENITGITKIDEGTIRFGLSNKIGRASCRERV